MPEEKTAKAKQKVKEATFKVRFRGAGMEFETGITYNVSSNEEFMAIQEQAYVTLGKSVRDFVSKASQQEK